MISDWRFGSQVAAARRVRLGGLIAATGMGAFGCGDLTVRLVGGTATAAEAWKAELLYAADDAS